MRNPLRYGILALLLVAGCKPKPSTPAATMTSGIESASFAPALEVDLSKCSKTAGGVYYRDLVTGSGPEVVKGTRVAVHYTGWLTTGTKFDSNGPKDAPYQLRVGAREVIDGWDQGLVGMRAGGKRQLIIPPTLAYGPKDYGPIPGNSVLVFTVEVVSAQ